MYKQNDCINWHVASTGVESCLCKQNRVVEKFYANPSFRLKFYAGWDYKPSAIKTIFFINSSSVVEEDAPVEDWVSDRVWGLWRQGVSGVQPPAAVANFL